MHRNKMRKYMAVVLSLLMVLGAGVPDRTWARSAGKQEISEADTALSAGDIKEIQFYRIADQEAQKVPSLDADRRVGRSASQETVFEQGTGDYGYKSLAAGQQILYSRIVESLTAFDNGTTNGEYAQISLPDGSISYVPFSVEFDDLNINQEDASQVWIAFSADRPWLFWLENGCALTSTHLMPMVRKSYWGDAADALQKRTDMKNKIENAVKEYNNVTVYYRLNDDIVREIEERIVSQVDFAYQQDTDTPEEADWAHTIEGVFDDGRKAAVSEGYAKAFAFLLNIFNIPNVYVTGHVSDGENEVFHAWNCVSFDNGETYYCMDLTWDDMGNGNNPTGNSYQYFAMPKSKFELKHTANTSAGKAQDWLYDLPELGDDTNYTYFMQFGSYGTDEEFKTDDDIREFLLRVRELRPNRLNTCAMKIDANLLVRIKEIMGYKSIRHIYAEEDDMYIWADTLETYSEGCPNATWSMDTRNLAIDLGKETEKKLSIANIVNGKGCGNYVRWHSDNNAVAVVKMPGYTKLEEGVGVSIVAKKAGTATIYADTSKGGSMTCKVEVTGEQSVVTPTPVPTETPGVTPEPTISMEGGLFSSDTFTLRIGLKHAISGTYKIGDNAAETYTSQKDITIGNGMETGQSIKIILTATDGSTTNRKEFTFKKTEAKKIYYSKPSDWVDPVYCYAWQDGAADDKNVPWPGVRMTKDEVTGYYFCEIGAHLNRVIFNDTSVQTDDLAVEPDGSWLYENGKWSEYSAPVVSVTIGEDTRYYSDITTAWEAAKGSTSTVTLLGESAVSQTLTVEDGDNITVTGKGSVSGAAGVSVITVCGGELTVRDGTFTAEDRAEGEQAEALYVAGGTVRLCGGTFSGRNRVIAITPDEHYELFTPTTGSMLGHTETVRYAYYKDGNLVTAGLDGTALTGTVTVQPCTHACQYTYGHTDGTTAHCRQCPACAGEMEGEETCSYDANGECVCGSVLDVALDGGEELVYNGEGQRPAVTVNLDGIKLDGTKYDAAYSANTDVGTASVIITGKDGLTFEKTVSFQIVKADAPVIGAVTKKYVYTAGSDGETAIDVAGKLPADRGNTEYTVSVSDADSILSGVSVDEKERLIYTVEAGTETGKTASITVTAKMANYNDAIFNVQIELVPEKTVQLQDGSSVSIKDSGCLTYGQALSDLVLNPAVFVEKGSGTEVKGTLAWKNPQTKPDAGTLAAEWVFTPENSREYAELAGTVEITVRKAVPHIAVPPLASGLIYGETLGGSTLTGGLAQYSATDLTAVAGSFAWKDGSAVPGSGSVQYAVVFTPSEGKNYENTELMVTVEVEKAENAPGMPSGTMSVAENCEKVSDVTLPPGWQWQEADKETVLSEGKTVIATAEYTGTDKGHYKNVSVTVSITRLSCSHEKREVRNAAVATCTANGYTGDVFCTDCGKKITSGTVIPATGHSYGEDWKSDENSHWHECHCGEKSGTAAHTEDSGTITKAPTQTETGVCTYKCSICGRVMRTVEIAKLPDATATPKPGETAAPTAKPGETVTPTAKPGPTAAPGETAPPAETPAATPEVTETPTAEPTTVPTAMPTGKPMGIPVQTDVPGTVLTPSVAPGETSAPVRQKKNMIKKGIRFVVGNLRYKVTKLKGGTGEVAVTSVKSKRAVSIVVPNKVRKNGISFTVTSIQKNAFKGCKKLRKLKLSAKRIKKMAKGSLNGLGQRVRITIPKSKLPLYRKVLKQCGFSMVK